jgi:hypothetical protein
MFIYFIFKAPFFLKVYDEIFWMSLVKMHKNKNSGGYPAQMPALINGSAKEGVAVDRRKAAPSHLPKDHYTKEN